MSKYTIELRECLSNPLFEVFDFDYDFYTTDLDIKRNFEVKFINHFFFHEIGFETVTRFKHRLRSELNKIAPYYKQLYFTEMKSKDIEYLLNKDYTETYTKTLLKDRIEDSTILSENKITNDNTSSNTNTNKNKESRLDNGVSSVSLNENYLTGIDEQNGEFNSTSKDDTLNNSKSQNNVTGQDSEKESYTLVGKGNIGITSSAELLDKWREILINIDELLIEHLDDLFLKIY